jgi:hypothetical protein
MEDRKDKGIRIKMKMREKKEIGDGRPSFARGYGGFKAGGGRWKGC